MQNNPNEIMAAAWNGVSGRAWVDEQQLLDRTYESIERLLAGEAQAASRAAAIASAAGPPEPRLGEGISRSAR